MAIDKELYNIAYKQFTPDFIQDKNISKIDRILLENSESLVDFIQKYKDQFAMDFTSMGCLEIGCGIGSLSHQLAGRFASYHAVDFSELAIFAAKEINKFKNSQIEFSVVDVCQDSMEQKFDIIIDSHLFHCLTDLDDREKYLEFVKYHLAEGGIFLMECMTFQNRLQTPVGYSFDENYTLWKEIDTEMHPVRSIRESRDIEQEIIANGLPINYLYYHNELSFQVFDDYENYPVEFLPKTIRLSAKLG